MIDLTGKNILITGASSGIGKATCLLASSLGARLIMTGRDEEKLKDTVNKCCGEDHLFFAQDLVDYELLNNNFTELFIKESMRIHGIVHAAGKDFMKPFALTKAQDFRDLFELNFISGLELIRFLSKKKFLPESGASYIFISSLMANLGAPGLSVYCASKSAISSTVKALALEYASKKCRINSVIPGYVETPLLKKSLELMSPLEVEAIYKAHPLGIGQPEDVAGLIVYLLSDQARWITGQNIVIDGGFSAR